MRFISLLILCVLSFSTGCTNPVLKNQLDQTVGSAAPSAPASKPDLGVYASSGPDAVVVVAPSEPATKPDATPVSDAAVVQVLSDAQPVVSPDVGK